MTDHPSPLADASQSEALLTLASLWDAQANRIQGEMLADASTATGLRSQQAATLAQCAYDLRNVVTAAARSSEPPASPAPASPDEPSTAAGRALVDGYRDPCAIYPDDVDAAEWASRLVVRAECEARAASASVPPPVNFTTTGQNWMPDAAETPEPSA